MLCVIARFICGAISGIVSLRNFSCGASHALCRYETFLRSVSRFVSLQIFFAERLTLCVIARFFCVASHTLCHCETFVCGAVSRFMSLRDFSAECLMLCVIARFICGASHALCRCEIYLRSGLTICVVEKFICGAISRSVSLRDFFAYHSKTYYLSPIIKYPFAYLSQPF